MDSNEPLETEIVAPNEGPRLDASPDVRAADAATDATTSLCTDQKKNGTETDVDCGGSACPKCNPGLSCAVDADCQASACSLGKCGPRAWTAESTGSNVAIPATQLWTAAPGLTVAPQLFAPALVYLRWTGTTRWAGGGNGRCHLGQRFVVDGVPTGDVNWGNALMVQNGATRVHEAFNAEIAVPLAAGTHTVSVEMTNGLGYGTCNLDGDGGLPYGRSRLLASAHDPKLTWYAESNGQTGGLVPGPWTDIPGVSAVFALPANSHVQVSLSGTQLAEGAATAHCAYRLVVDGAPLGDPNHGQAIAVADVAAGWWSPVALKYGADLPAGPHAITAQIRNSNASTGTCNAGQGNNAYARFKMLVASNPAGGIATSVESAGGAYLLGSTSAWTAIGGLGATFNVPSAGHVQFELAATQRTVSGLGHCAWRYVIDGVPLGDANHGQAINMGDGAVTWWTSTPLTWGQTFAAGSHTVRVEARNSSTTGDCGTNGDGLPYGRARLLIRAP
jgi:hypothetical protein